jgi:predicted GTPase
MPVPLIIAVGCLIAGGLAGGLAVHKWEDVQFALRGKRIAVLGARQVGKTTLLTYITKGVLIESYKANVLNTDTERKRLKISDLDIRLRKTKDVAGSNSADQRFEWHNLCKDSDFIFYIVRTDLLLQRNKETEERIKDDLRHIGEWIKDSDKLVVIVGNHWNTDSEYRNLTPDKVGQYVDKFKALPIMQDINTLAGGAAKVRVALGSLEPNEDKFAEILVTAIFTQVLRK